MQAEVCLPFAKRVHILPKLISVAYINLDDFRLDFMECRCSLERYSTFRHNFSCGHGRRKGCAGGHWLQCSL